MPSGEIHHAHRFSKHRRGHCGACKRDDVPLNPVHVPDLCVECKAKIEHIDTFYSNVRDIRRETILSGIPLSGAGAQSNLRRIA